MLLDRFKLTDQVAIISGGGRGIGRAVTLAFAEAGAKVVCTARTEDQLTKTATDAEALGAEALAVRCDVNDADQLDNVIQQTLDRFDRIDLLVNVAGGTLPSLALNTTQQQLEEAFHFNVSSAFLLSQKVIARMVKVEGGAIVNISSALSHLVENGFVAYGTAKAALNHMTRLMAHEFAPKVRVNALAVGAVETEALAPFLASGGLKEQMEAMTPLGRLGTVEDIALAALYLASPAASWITGKVYEIDGGTVASNWPLKMPGY